MLGLRPVIGIGINKYKTLLSTRYLLNYYPDAAAAYSLRQLDVNYTGPAIRVRRDSDNSETNIGFVDGQLDTESLLSFASFDITQNNPEAIYSLRYIGNYTGPVVRIRRSSDNSEQNFTPTELTDGTLETFCGSSNGFVAIWYDQIGTHNCINTVAGSQPKLYDSSTGLLIINGKPAIYFDGIDDYLVSNTLASIMNGDDQPLSIFSTFYKSDTGYDSLWEFDSSATHINYIAHSWRNDSKIQIVKRVNTSALVAGGTTVYSPNTQYLNTFLSDGISILDINNETEFINSSINQAAYTDLDLFVIGGKRRGTFDYGDYLKGYVQEMIIFPSDQTSNRLNIEANINGYYSIYSSSFTPTGYDCFVTTWYDQSGNGYDATQTTAAYQPQIVSSGSVITENGKPCVQFDGSNDYLPTDNVATYFSGEDLPITRIIAMTPNDDAGENFFTFSSSLSNYALKQLEIYGGQYTLLYRTASNVQKSSSFSPVLLQQQLIEEYNNGTIANVYLDSVNRINNFDIDLPSIILDRATIGALRRSSIINYFDGTIQEVILYPSDQSSNRTGIESNINSQYQIYWDGSQTSLLDSYGGSAAAYSLRALSSSYTGALIKVRRASDNAEQDIYAKYDGTLNIDALESFCASTDGFVTTWYDQSGNGNDATQSTAVSQPQIVSSGSTILENGKPAIKPVAGVNFTAIFTVSSNMTAFHVDTRGSQTAVSSYYMPNGRLQDDSGYYWINQNTTNTKLQNNSGTSNFYINSIQFTGTTRDDAYNFDTGNQRILAVTNLDLSSWTGYKFQYGASDITFEYFQERIFYPSDQSSNRTGIETNINSHYNIY